MTAKNTLIVTRRRSVGDKQYKHAVIGFELNQPDECTETANLVGGCTLLIHAATSHNPFIQVRESLKRHLIHTRISSGSLTCLYRLQVYTDLHNGAVLFYLQLATSTGCPNIAYRRYVLPSFP
jgi:hypothetical protein